MRVLGIAVVVVAGCGFEHGTLGESTTLVVDDSVEDFAAGELNDITVDKLGYLAPDAFALGGLHARAYGSPFLSDTSTWSNLQPMLTTPLGERYSSMPGSFAFDRPYGLGLARTDNFTVVYDGELHLDAGTRTLQVTADDIALVELDLGGVRPAVFAHVSDGQPARLTFEVPKAGWYPIRAALSEAGSDAFLRLALVEANTPRAVDPSELRARVTSAHGVTVTASPDRVFAARAPDISIEPSLIDRTFGSAVPPYDFAGVSTVYYALRYAGQLRVETTEARVFAFDLGTDTTRDYARLLIDGKPIAGRWPGLMDQLTSEPLELTPGWHDILLDYAQSDATARLQLTMSSATRAATAIEPMVLRPVRDGGLLTSVYRNENINLVDGAALDVALKLDAPAGATVQFLDAYFTLYSQTRTEMTASLEGPGGADPIMIPTTASYDMLYDYFPNRTAAVNAPVDGTWHLVLTDNSPTTTGYIYYPALMATYRGGPDKPYAETMSYVSAPHDLRGTLLAIRATGELDGAQLVIEARSGSETTLEAAPWQSPEATPPGELVQYRLTLTSDGWQYPTIDRVELDIRRDVPAD
ncbi:MAG TPA: hypothetical protein VMZ53_27125 [Kofleriaceae bacterium]|nr:hypothetical protein [Kofleriaceae bacterium]